MKRSTYNGFNEGVVAYFVLLFLFLTPLFTHAATLSIESEGIQTDGSLLLSVYVNTHQRSPINAAAATIPFVLRESSVRSVEYTNSIFDMWVDEPHIQNDAIHFSGGTTGGGGFIFKGKLFEIYLDVPQKSSGTFSFKDATVRAHDGEGTDILKSALGYAFSVEQAVPSHFDTNSDGTVSIVELSIGLSS